MHRYGNSIDTVVWHLGPLLRCGGNARIVLSTLRAAGALLP